MAKDYIIEFILGNTIKKQTFSYESELFEIYVFCAKAFNCGIFSISFLKINLNFVDKNTKLNTLIPESTDTIKIKIIPQMKRKKIIHKQTDNIKSLVVQKGIISSILLNTPYLNIEKLYFKGTHLNYSDIYSFLTYYQDSKVDYLKIPPHLLVDIDDTIGKLKMKAITDIKKLCVYGLNSKYKEIKLNESEINVIDFPKVKVLKLKNVDIQIKNKFPKLRKLSLINAFGFNRHDLVKNYNQITYLELSYQIVDDLYEQLHFFSEKMQKIDILKIKFNSIDIINRFSLKSFFDYKVLSISNEIYLNLKAKFEKITNGYKVNDNVLSHIKEMKFLPYSKFDEKDLEIFNNGMKSLSHLQILNLDNKDYKTLETIISKSPQLEYLHLDDSSLISINNQKNQYKIISRTNDLLYLNSLNTISSEKIRKIILPCIDYSEKKKYICITGDCLPDKEVNESFFLMMKKLIFSTNRFNTLIIKDFNIQNNSFLHRILALFVNVISSPKIYKIKLINVLIDKKLIDEISFIIMNSSSYLLSIEINNLSFDTNESQFLFYTILCQIEYANRLKIKFKSIEWNDNLTDAFSETNILNHIDILSFQSITNFDLIEDILNAPSLKGIELKDLPITAEQLTSILSNNGKSYHYLSFDLDFNIYKCLSSDNLVFPNLKVLKIGEGFQNYNNRVKLDFLDSKWKDMKKLTKAKLCITNMNKDKREKIINLYKYLTNLN